MMHDETPLLTVRGPWGVPVQIAPSFLFLGLLFIGFSPDLNGLIFFGLIVLAIFLHEFGHAWGCLVQGQPVRRVVLWGGGGFCEQQRTATARETELIVIMGPLVNLALWAMSSLAASWMVNLATPPLGDLWWDIEFWLFTFAQINIVLFVLNLVPVQPLDGGRLFHLGLLRLVRPEIAVRVAGAVGLCLAVLWVPGMIFAYITWGYALLFMPPIALHWHMMRGRAAF
ncbi:MAG: site-2 protease family protein [Pseudomonadota bacterium]